MPDSCLKHSCTCHLINSFPTLKCSVQSPSYDLHHPLIPPPISAFLLLPMRTPRHTPSRGRDPSPTTPWASGVPPAAPTQAQRMSLGLLCPPYNFRWSFTRSWPKYLSTLKYLLPISVSATGTREKPLHLSHLWLPSSPPLDHVLEGRISKVALTTSSLSYSSTPHSRLCSALQWHLSPASSWCSLLLLQKGRLSLAAKLLHVLVCLLSGYSTYMSVFLSLFQTLFN